MKPERIRLRGAVTQRPTWTTTAKLAVSAGRQADVPRARWSVAADRSGPVTGPVRSSDGFVVQHSSSLVYARQTSVI